jgi:hypothetical protein
MIILFTYMFIYDTIDGPGYSPVDNHAMPVHIRTKQKIDIGM